MLKILDWAYAYRKLMAVATAYELDVSTHLFWGEEREPMPLGSVLDWLGEAGFSGARSFPLTERSQCILATRGGL